MFGISSFAAAPFASLASQSSLVALNGVQASGAAGSMVPSITFEISGNLSYGEPGGVSEEPNITIAGVYAIGEVGSVIFTKEISINGVAGAGAVGSVGGASDRSTELSGITAAGGLGTFGVLHENAIIEAGGWGTGTWGQAEWGVGAGYPPATSAQVGNVSAGNAQNITGLEANGYVGTFGVIHINGLLSVLAQGYVGNVSNYFWTTIDDDQTPNWVNINNE